MLKYATLTKEQLYKQFEIVQKEKEKIPEGIKKLMVFHGFNEKKFIKDNEEFLAKLESFPKT